MHREVPICLRRLQLPTRIQKTKAQFLNSPVPRCQIRGGSLTTRARTELGVGESGVGGFHPPSCYKFMCTRERFSSTDQMIECDLYMRKSLKGGGKIYRPPDSRNPNSRRSGPQASGLLRELCILFGQHVTDSITAHFERGVTIRFACI